MSLISDFTYSLLVYRSMTDVSVFVLYIVTLPNLLTGSRRLFFLFFFFLLIPRGFPHRQLCHLRTGTMRCGISFISFSPHTAVTKTFVD